MRMHLEWLLGAYQPPPTAPAADGRVLMVGTDFKHASPSSHYVVAVRFSTRILPPIQASWLTKT